VCAWLKTIEEIGVLERGLLAMSIAICFAMLYSRLELRQIKAVRMSAGRQTAIFVQAIFSEHTVSEVELTCTYRSYIATTLAGHLLCVSWYLVHQARTT
jgi:hypothetical protein